MNGGSFRLRAVIESWVENQGAYLLLSGRLLKAEGRGLLRFYGNEIPQYVFVWFYFEQAIENKRRV